MVSPQAESRTDSLSSTKVSDPASYEKVSTNGGTNEGRGDKMSSKESSHTTNKKKKTKNQTTASVLDTLSFVYRSGFGTRVLFVVGFISGIFHGLAWPALAYFLSRSYQTMSEVATIDSDPMEEIRQISYTFMGLGTYSLVTAFLQTFSLELVSSRASRLLQLEWFRALLRQDAAFFDVSNVAGMAASVGSGTMLYSKGVGRKLGELIQNLATGLGGLAFAFYSTWRVALLVCAILPVVAGASYMAIQLNQTKTARASLHYQDAGSVAYKTISGFRTVLSLNAVEEMIRQYKNATQHAFESASSSLVKLGFWNGMITGSLQSLFAVVVLFGSFVLYREVEASGCDPAGGGNGCPVTGADVFGAMLGILFAAQSASQVGNCGDCFQEARVAVYEALRVITRRPGNTPAETIYSDDDDDVKEKDSDGAEEEGLHRPDSASRLKDGSSYVTAGISKNRVKAVLPPYEIDPFAKDGLKPKDVQGRLEFRNIGFSYPTRPSEHILSGLNMEIPAGKTVALVGPSGGGKSTAMALIERFYDPLEGSVSLDGTNIKDLNLAHYRHLMGYVGQEPVLFSGTIAENIAYGARGGKATQDEIEAAARMANAHDFIVSFPNGYQTEVGDKGSHLSGGQKQRIAIARVLVSDPKILLLDEATSALDSESELVVQDALDNILEKRSLTTVIIAHRLSTIRSADIIYVISDGNAVEFGTHEELMESEKGYYRELVEKQDGTSRKTRRTSTRDSFSSTASASSQEETFSSEVSHDNAANPVLSQHQTPQIEFHDVCFAYPARPSKTIFEKFNLSVMPGETVALVGPSGGGKSTTVALIERFYDPIEGVLRYMGHDVKSLQVKWYRDQIGYVGQEPVLFNTTIAKNIAYGFPSATQADIEEAAKQANAHQFIMQFSDGYETHVGDGGGRLSGGQKQRVAIARALVKKPKLLILDEATSALDSESEAIVHEALSKLMLSHKQTTIVIAHKLSTVMDADRIAFIANGKVMEVGTHDELLSRSRGHYKRLVEAQKRGSTLETLLEFSTRDDSVQDSASEKEEVTDDFIKNELVVDDAKSTVLKRIRQMAAPDIAYLLIGSIGAVLSGASYPLMGILFAMSIDLYYYQVSDCTPAGIANQTLSSLGFETCEDYWSDAAENMQQKSFDVALYYFLLVVDAVVGAIVLIWGFGQASERLSRRFRDDTFTALVRQEIGYFDKRSIGDITSELQESTARLHAFSGAPIRQFLEATTALMTGVVLSFISMWPFALLCSACIPFMAISSMLRRRSLVGQDEGATDTSEKLKSSGGILVETLLNIRTVSALALEKKRFNAYEAAVRESQKRVIWTSVTAGLASGMGMFIQRFTNALLYFWGGYLLINYPDKYVFSDFLIAQFSFIFSSFGLAAALQDMDDRNEVEESAKRIFSILDRVSEIDPLSVDGKTLD